jgi:predicted  nucleic acid-binding Zn-ribbon protein
MSVDWYVCVICGKVFPDCDEYFNCIHCGGMICSYCYNEQKEKYDTLDEAHPKHNFYGDSALNRCDSCAGDEYKQKLFDEIISTLDHAKIFIETREKMHPDGIKLYIELCHKLKQFVNG